MADEGVAQLQQLDLLEGVELDLSIPDVVKGQFLRVGTDRAAGHRRGEVDTPDAVAHVALALALRTTFQTFLTFRTA
jgi:hypothetical protein